MFVRFVYLLPCHVSFIVSALVRVTNSSQQFSSWEIFLKDKWSTVTFVTSYLPIVLFPVIYVSVKVITKVPLVGTSVMDFESGVSGTDATTCVFVLLDQVLSV